MLVLEIGGELDDFAGAVRNVPGLELLADELEEEKAEPDDFAVVDNTGRRRPYSRELFVVASDYTAYCLAAAVIALAALAAR